jgi:hypothetical protein
MYQAKPNPIAKLTEPRPIARPHSIDYYKSQVRGLQLGQLAAGVSAYGTFAGVMDKLSACERKQLIDLVKARTQKTIL